jgi:hypothetical protein
MVLKQEMVTIIYQANPVGMFWHMYEQNTRQYNNKLIGSVALTYTPTDFLGYYWTHRYRSRYA